MTYPRIVYKNTRVVHDHSLGSRDEAEIFIDQIPNETSKAGFVYKITYRSTKANYKETAIFDSDSIGRANLSVVNHVLIKLKDVETKNIFIYIKSDYVVNMVPKITGHKPFAKLRDMKNYQELETMSNLLKTVGFKHYILIRKDKKFGTPIRYMDKM